MNTSAQLRFSVGDFLRFSKSVRRITSYAFQSSDYLSSPKFPDEYACCLERLALAGRLGYELRDLTLLESRIQARIDLWSPARFSWNKYFPRSEPRQVLKSIILKSPRPGGEKGVLFVAFEDHWLRLFRNCNISQLARDYDLVISPTWSPPYDLALFLAAKLWPGTLFTILSNHDDTAAFAGIAKNIKIIPLLASNWVNPSLFARSSDPEKQYDIVMLANFAKYKRHFALFRALRKMNPGVRVLLLGRPMEGRTQETLENEAHLFGVRDRITIKAGLDDAEMIEALQSSKVSIIMSMVEGSCVAVAESIYADVPVGLIEGARIGSSIFINEHTGCFLRPGALAQDLSAFVERYRHYAPRKWALQQGIGCQESSLMLNEALKSFALKNAHSWTVDIVPMHWRPNAEFLFPEHKEAMQSEYSRFEYTYGVSIGHSSLATV